MQDAQNLEISLWESALQPFEKKLSCDKRGFDVTTTFPLAPNAPEVEIVCRRN
jgi:hypothetical protein